MGWVGAELTISARKSARNDKVGHTAASSADGSAQLSMTLNKEVVKRKEKGDCKGGRKKLTQPPLFPHTRSPAAGLVLCTGARGIQPS